MVDVLDLGCGSNKFSGSYGVDFVKTKDVNFVWDLNKKLPNEFNSKYDVVYSKCVIDHLGNPMLFLDGCKNYLKRGGKLILIADNCDYWRFHFDLGCYHATLWDNDAPTQPETHHKMLFQMEHLLKILRLLNFKIVQTKYIHETSLRKGHIDYLLPKKFGCDKLRIEAIKDDS